VLVYQRPDEKDLLMKFRQFSWYFFNIIIAIKILNHQIWRKYNVDENIMWNEVPNRGWIFKKAFGPINFKGIIKCTKVKTY